MTPEKIDALVPGWHHKSRELALVLAEKYGPPDEVTQSRLTWLSRGLWKRTSVHREPLLHRWPTPHDDVIEQVIDHYVPPEKVADITALHGGLSIRRTAGELVVCCESEEANACAVNLAHDLIESRCTLTLARVLFAERFAGTAHEATHPYLKGPIFGQQVSTADADEPREIVTPRRSSRKRAV